MYRTPSALHTQRILALALVSLLNLACVITVSAQTAWSWQNPLPHGNTINTIFFADALHGWTGADAGLISHTENGGESWTLQHSGIPGRIDDMHFTSAQNGWAVSSNDGGLGTGHILRTIDGGQHWEQVNIGSQERWGAVFFSDTNTGWIAGGTKIYRTTNGGTSWTPVTVPGFTAEDIFFLDAQHGWAVGFQGLIYASIDGGATWNPQTSGVTNQLRAVQFTDELNGFVAGRQSTLLQTVDGGATWEKQDMSAGLGWFEDLHFSDAQHGWIATTARRFDGAVMLRTTDGGSNWEEIRNRAAYETRAVITLDAISALAAGEAGDIRRTSDGGTTWQRKTKGSPDLFYGVAFGNSQFGLAGRTFVVSDSLTGAEDPIETRSVEGTTNLVTPDGGKTWVPDDFDRICSQYVWDVAKNPNFNNNITWLASVCGDSYVHAAKAIQTGPRSAGYELEWQSFDTGTPEELSGVCVYDASHWWVVGTGGVIMHTPDAGETWINQYADPAMRLEAIFFVNETHGWAVGDDGVILHSDDSGETWTPQTSASSSADLTRVLFLDTQRGWLLGQGGGGSLQRTTNGGQTWQFQSYGSSGALYDLAFADETHGWAVGQGGLIVATSDGGQTWAPQSSPTTNTLLGVDFVDANKGWAVGDLGTIIHFNATSTATKEIDRSNSSTIVERIYPNPTTGEITIAFEFSHPSDISISLFDLHGRLLQVPYRAFCPAGPYEQVLDLNSLSAGLYFIHVQTEWGVETRKVVVE